MIPEKKNWPGRRRVQLCPARPRSHGLQQPTAASRVPGRSWFKLGNKIKVRAGYRWSRGGGGSQMIHSVDVISSRRGLGNTPGRRLPATLRCPPPPPPPPRRPGVRPLLQESAPGCGPAPPREEPPAGPRGVCSSPKL